MLMWWKQFVADKKNVVKVYYIVIPIHKNEFQIFICFPIELYTIKCFSSPVIFEFLKVILKHYCI